MSFQLYLVLLTASAVIAGYWWYALVYQSFIGGEPLVRVHFLDVGQGDAVLIEAPDGTQVLVDAGRGISVLHELAAVMPVGDRSLDVGIMTHPDADHIGGFVPVLDRYEVAIIVQPFLSSPSEVYHAVHDSLVKERKEGGVVHRVSSAQRFVAGGATFSLLWPLDETVRERNAASIVLHVRFGEMDMLLTGDAPVAVEDMLVALYPDLLTDVEIIKAGHHGSKTSLSSTLLAHTTPEAIVFSYGADNRYGHPHHEVIDRIAAYRKEAPTVSLHRTEDGTVSFCLTTETFYRC